ncbi:MAG: Spx/MgsR family RNA polymerase-binding regulatory protein [Pseudomonadota bacterium]
MRTKIFGIANCDTVKRAKRWLDSHSVEYDFHDFRVDGLERSLLEEWVSAESWRTIVNQRSKSWRSLDQNRRDSMDDNTAIAAILEQPTLIKRPVLERERTRLFGFDEAAYRDIFE